MTDLITKIDALYEKATLGAFGMTDTEHDLWCELYNSWPAIRAVLVAAQWQAQHAPGVTVTELHEALARLNGGKL